MSAEKVRIESRLGEQSFQLLCELLVSNKVWPSKWQCWSVIVSLDPGEQCREMSVEVQRGIRVLRDWNNVKVFLILVGLLKLTKIRMRSFSSSITISHRVSTVSGSKCRSLGQTFALRNSVKKAIRKPLHKARSWVFPISINLYILLSMTGVIGRTWFGVPFNFLFRPCKVSSIHTLSDGKWYPSAWWRYLIPPNTFFKCPYPLEFDISSKKMHKSSSEAGRSVVLKWIQK